MSAAYKLVAWEAPCNPDQHKYVLVGVVVSDEPIENFQVDKVCVMEMVGTKAEELRDALHAIPKRAAVHQGRSAGDYLRELGVQ